MAHADAERAPIRIPERTHRDLHLLLWVAGGEAAVRCGDEHHGLVAGDAMLIPATMPHEVTVDADGLVVPISIPTAAVDQQPVATSTVSLDLSWSDWMLHHFAAWASPLRSPGYRVADIVSTLDRTGRAGLPLPRTSPGRDIAAAMVRDPAIASALDEWALQTRVSPRTLRRIFRRETQMSFGQWRTACRLEAGAEFLQAGYSVAHTAHQVGFATPYGFIRAFTRRFGQTPDSWRRADGTSPRVSDRVRRARDGQTLMSALRDVDCRTPPAVPATSAPPRVHIGQHVILWVHKGQARVRVDDRVHALSRGDAIWMPANVEHAVEVDAASIALPLVFGPEDVTVTLEDVTVVRIDPAVHDEVLRQVVANLTPIRPPGYRRLDILDLFAEHRMRRDEPTSPMPADPAARTIARHVARTPGRDRTLAQLAAELGVDVDGLDRTFRDQTGRSFTAWRTALRMSVARGLLDAGTSPSAAARHVGYRHLSGFSRDFTRHHGLSPRAYQRAR